MKIELKEKLRLLNNATFVKNAIEKENVLKGRMKMLNNEKSV
ncbi:11514_t:CDS:2 [Funneliformis mosseae]|uniref:11514_t:CDS:1 n=1 Tax=Funneliformis mosseae TaxID=27381 RepID=A0A9N9GD68_FUNMO|nr:11514_t:CDS:2 [Funneliformis mosseae]